MFVKSKESSAALQPAWGRLAEAEAGKTYWVGIHFRTVRQERRPPPIDFLEIASFSLLRELRGRRFEKDLPRRPRGAEGWWRRSRPANPGSLAGPGAWVFLSWLTFWIRRRIFPACAACVGRML